MSTMSRLVAAAAGLPVILHGSLAVALESKHNLPPPVTPIAREIYDLHLLMLAICCVIFVGVFSVMFYSIYAHRKSVGHKAVPFHENTTVEIVWTIIPLFILIGMAWPATKTRPRDEGHVEPRHHDQGDRLPVEVGLRLPEGRGRGHRASTPTCRPRASRSTNRARQGRELPARGRQTLVVPVDKKVRILTTANDVIHAWWVPAFGVKQDAIPGFVRDTWFRAEKVGIYRGQCAELCGKDHAFMPIVVEVVSPADYATWVGDQKKRDGGRRGRSGQDLDAGRASGARREGLRRQLRGVPPGERHGRAAPFPALAGSRW